MKTGKQSEFSLDSEGVLRCNERLCVPNVGDLKKQILEEAHCTPYSIHPGATKMYQDLKQLFWWEGMTKDVAEFVSRCLTCQQVKAEHQKPAGLHQRIEIPEWKWERITMDFTFGGLIQDPIMFCQTTDQRRQKKRHRQTQQEYSQNRCHLECGVSLTSTISVFRIGSRSCSLCASGQSSFLYFRASFKTRAPYTPKSRSVKHENL